MRIANRGAGLLAGAILCAGAVAAFADGPLARTRVAWTYEEAREAFARAPDDALTQFILIQMAREAGHVEEAESLIRSVNRFSDRSRGDHVDLFSLTSGSLAIQESLQLDTLLNSGPAMDLNGTVSVDSLAGPGVESHPWGEMLAGRTPAVSELSLCVPADKFYIQARSPNALLEIVDSGELWERHVVIQAGASSGSTPLARRVQKQLAIEMSDSHKFLYDTVVGAVAACGSDLYLQEGTDITMLFQLKQPELFRGQMDEFLSAAAAQPGASSTTSRFRGIEIRHVETPDRLVHVYAADPRPLLHVRSNSASAMQAVLEQVLDEENAATSLGETDEFRYIRTLLPEAAPEEDLLVYLSDPFVRRILGPRVKLTERRRLIGLSHLRILENSAVLFQTQYGRNPSSLEELLKAGCAPSEFAEDGLKSPFGGRYSLAADGMTAVCKVLGTLHAPTPCCDLPLVKVNQEEADEYAAFVTNYEQYWRRYFDPIAIRVRSTPTEFRAETIVLPLIDNSIYQSLREVVGGEPADLETLPVPNSNIGSITAHLNKANFAERYGMMLDIGSEAAFSDGPPPPDVMRLLTQGLGDSISFNVCDGDPLFDLNMTQFGAIALRFGNADGVVGIGLLVASLTSPVYIGIPVENAEVVDQFLEALDQHLALQARRDWGPLSFDFSADYYLLDHDQPERPSTRVAVVHFGPLTWRFYFARIGNGLYLASRLPILDEIAVAPAAPPADPSVKAHLRLRYRPEHWDRILPSYQLGWAENARRAVFRNLGSLDPLLRACLAMQGANAASDPEQVLAETLQRAERLQGRTFALPDGGSYALSKDGRHVVHSAYGDVALPHQRSAPAAGGPLETTINNVDGVVADLTFLDDGLHAVVTVKRRRN